MTAAQLKTLCQNAIDDFVPNAGSKFPFIRLTLPGAPRGAKKRLSKVAGAPSGEVLMEVGGNKCLCVFDAAKVLAFCLKMEALPA